MTDVAPACRLWLAAGPSAARAGRLELSQRRAQRIKARGVGESVVLYGAPDCRCYCGELVVGEGNCRLKQTGLDILKVVENRWPMNGPLSDLKKDLAAWCYRLNRGRISRDGIQERAG